MDEIWWDERLSPYNRNPHFPYFITHFTDSMPICSVGGSLFDMLRWPGTSADVTIWDQRGPLRTHGQFFDYEAGQQMALIAVCMCVWPGRHGQEQRHIWRSIAGFGFGSCNHPSVCLLQWGPGARSLPRVVGPCSSLGLVSSLTHTTKTPQRNAQERVRPVHDCLQTCATSCTCHIRPNEVKRHSGPPGRSIRRLTCVLMCVCEPRFMQ